MIVLTADHGEEFYDHGGWWHGTSLFDEQVHVPLIAKLSENRRSGSVDTRLVRSLDIVPGIIEAAGGTVPGAMQGTSFLGEESTEQKPVFAEEDHENNVIRSLRVGRWKLILTEEGSPRMPAPVQLFDMDADPDERNNLARQHPAVVKRLRSQLEDISDRIKSAAYAAQESEVDDATRERLKALGYVE